MALSADFVELKQKNYRRIVHCTHDLLVLQATEVRYLLVAGREESFNLAQVIFINRKKKSEIQWEETAQKK